MTTNNGSKDLQIKQQPDKANDLSAVRNQQERTEDESLYFIGSAGSRLHVNAWC